MSLHIHTVEPTNYGYRDILYSTLTFGVDNLALQYVVDQNLNGGVLYLECTKVQFSTGSTVLYSAVSTV